MLPASVSHPHEGTNLYVITPYASSLSFLILSVDPCIWLHAQHRIATLVTPSINHKLILMCNDKLYSKLGIYQFNYTYGSYYGITYGLTESIVAVHYPSLQQLATSHQGATLGCTPPPSDVLHTTCTHAYAYSVTLCTGCSSTAYTLRPMGVVASISWQFLFVMALLAAFPYSPLAEENYLLHVTLPNTTRIVDSSVTCP